MANRNLDQHRMQFEGAVVDIWGVVAIGATGAPTLTVAQSTGIASITRTSQGLYQVTLSDTYNRLLEFTCQNFGAAQDLVFQPTTDWSATNKTFSFSCLTAAVATDPTNGNTLKFKVSMKNSSVL